MGHDKWLAAQQELLGEVAEDGHSDTKFVRGAYGSGKSHFLSVIQEYARQNGWMTSHVECRTDGVQIDRFETLYPKIVANLESSDLGDLQISTSGDGARLLLERWTNQQIGKAGLKQDASARPLDADGRLYTQLSRELLKSELQPDFVRALMAFSRATLAEDLETVVAVTQWFKGSSESVRVPAAYSQKPSSDLSAYSKGVITLRSIGKSTAQEALRGILWLIRSAQYAGLVLCIDEIEELAKLASRRRQDQALQALREFVDHAGGEGGFSHLCLYLAATPEMFEGPNYFPRYDALATRIQALSPQLNWRAPVVDLDKTPLGVDQMVEVATRIREVHKAAYGSDATKMLASDFIEKLVAELASSRFRIAKPRLLARVVIDELERARQQGGSFQPDAEMQNLIQSAALKLTHEASQ